MQFGAKLWPSLFLAALSTCTAAGQNPEALSQAFEGKQVTVKMDMPASQKGVDLYPDKPQPLDTKNYAKRLKDFGVALRKGDAVMVTKVKFKNGNVEFQLGGGGYGTAGDNTDESVHFQPADKSAHEKELEDQLKTETDEDRRRSISRELDDLRRDRERQDRRDRARAEEDADMRRQQISENRVQGGSRFNIHFDKQKSGNAVTPEMIISALSAYVSFTPEAQGGASLVPQPQPVSGDPAKSLKKGLTRAQVEALFGPPTETHEKTEDGLTRTICSYQNATQTVQADFVNGVLVQYTLSSR